MPVKFYTGEDFGGGCQATNILDPVNPGDVATKQYVDAHPNTPKSGQILWEKAYNMTCSSNSWSGLTASIYTGPNVQTITKLRGDTGIRVTFGTSCWVTPANGQVIYSYQVDGTGSYPLITYWSNTANHVTLPWASATMSGALISFTGSMDVTFLIATGSGTTWHTDANDFCAWTIAEVMP